MARCSQCEAIRRSLRLCFDGVSSRGSDILPRPLFLSAAAPAHPFFPSLGLPSCAAAASSRDRLKASIVASSSAVSGQHPRSGEEAEGALCGLWGQSNASRKTDGRSALRAVSCFTRDRDATENAHAVSSQRRLLSSELEKPMKQRAHLLVPPARRFSHLSVSSPRQSAPSGPPSPPSSSASSVSSPCRSAASLPWFHVSRPSSSLSSSSPQSAFRLAPPRRQEGARCSQPQCAFCAAERPHWRAASTRSRVLPSPPAVIPATPCSPPSPLASRVSAPLAASSDPLDSSGLLWASVGGSPLVAGLSSSRSLRRRFASFARLERVLAELKASRVSKTDPLEQEEVSTDAAAGADETVIDASSMTAETTGEPQLLDSPGRDLLIGRRRSFRTLKRHRIRESVSLEDAEVTEASLTASCLFGADDLTAPRQLSAASSSLASAAPEGPPPHASSFLVSPSGSSPVSSAAPPPASSSCWSVMKSLTEEDVENFPRYEKPFVDFMWCEAKAGNGGKPKQNAVRSRNFRGPGYGGHGGNVILEADIKCHDFLQLEETLRADDGGDGEGTSRGLHAKDKVIKVPLGTIVRKRVPTGRLSREGRRYKESIFWGRGGIAPSTFKKKDGRPPEPGERNSLELELRLLNDVALLGAPNSGKTAFAAAVTRYQSKIGSEGLQTRRPHIGTLRYVDGVEFKLMDLPALCPGAHQDKKRGMRVLRHLYRSRLLVYVIDVARGSSVHRRPAIKEEKDRLLLTGDTDFQGSPSEGEAGEAHYAGVTGQGDPLEDFLYLREEVMKHRKDNEGKKELIIATKCDALHRGSLYHLDSLYYRLRSQYPEIPIVGVSARFGLGLQEAVSTIRQLLGPEDWLVKERRVQMDESWEEFLLPNQAEEDRALRRLDFFPLPPVNLPANVGVSTHPPPSLTTKIVGSHGFSEGVKKPLNPSQASGVGTIATDLDEGWLVEGKHGDL
ncbi:GTP-binding protein [Besnoitia besnoiti]|uniref:GTP-binding protein n=1 Tax=Besnoitia besnoiti TaxID=94643 RepID=A0A2A9M5X7_BESBE|nr:GTP-binding protein [Besnoitia besnoiti]PFH33339.1 GTP-binding protein [Besnoitia besnoiti]